MAEKSANQRWKESDTTLSFKDWIDREKKKYLNADGSNVNEQLFIFNRPLNDSIQDTLSRMRGEGTIKTAPSSDNILGINKTVVIVSAVILVGAIGYSIYRYSKKK